MGHEGNAGKEVAKVVMVPLIISHDGAIHRDTFRRWKNFATDIKVDWVWMAQRVTRYNVFIVGKFFNRGCWVSEALIKAHLEEMAEQDPEGPPERIATAAERREMLHLDTVSVGAVCAAFGHATSTWRSADVCWKGKPKTP